MRPLLYLAALSALAATALPAAAAGLDVPEGGMAISSDLTLLPPAVQKSHGDLLAAALSGDIDKLADVLAAQPSPVTVSFGDPEDPIAYLKQESGDGEGVEILAILADILASPYAAFDQGDGDLGYVWPAIAYYEDITALSPADTVVAYRIMGREAFEAMKPVGNWLFWRLYLGDEGEVQAFVAGD